MRRTEETRGVGGNSERGGRGKRDKKSETAVGLSGGSLRVSAALDLGSYPSTSLPGPQSVSLCRQASKPFQFRPDLSCPEPAKFPTPSPSSRTTYTLYIVTQEPAVLLMRLPNRTASTEWLVQAIVAPGVTRQCGTRTYERLCCLWSCWSVLLVSRFLQLAMI